MFMGLRRALPVAVPRPVTVASLAEMKPHGAILFVLVLSMIAAGCAKKQKVRIPAAPGPGWTEVGIASWYGHPYHGRQAANGEIYDMEKLTAAHRTLPFGTWVAVENLSNRKKVTVRINDRGPFVDGRVIDLSRAAARMIDMIGPGTVKVRLTVTERPKGAPREEHYGVQVGAFEDRRRAEALRRSIARKYGSARLVERRGDPTLWRVIAGDRSTIDEANALAARLRAELGSAFVVRLDENP